MRLRLLTALLASMLLAGCAMVDSSPLERAEGFRCDSAAGAYFLPKTQLLVEVEQDVSTQLTGTLATGKTILERRRDYSLKLNYRRVPDSRFGFCLDYLAAITSDDVVNIKKYPGSHLLGLVSTDAVDESRFILQTLIRSVFIAASGDPTFGSGFGRSFAEGIGTARKVIVFKGEFDPFDAARVAEINQAMKEYGFCLVMPGLSLNKTEHGTSSYCEHPRVMLGRVGAPDLQYRHKSNEGLLEQGRRRGEGGIFYRPRIPYPIHVYIKDNMKVPHWRLGISKAIEMENISPLVAVGVDRTTFAQRKTSLVFTEGQLDNVCIYKGSELLSFSYIPLQIVQSIVALPTAIVQVKIDQTKNLDALNKAESALIKTQLDHLKFLGDIEKDPSKATAATANTANVGKFESHKNDTNAKYNLATATATDAERDKVCPVAASVTPGIAAGGLKYNDILTPQ